MWYILCMNFCFAAALPFLKLAGAYSSPFELVAIRMLLSGLILSIVGFVRGSRLPWDRTNWRLLLVTGIIGTYLLCGAEAWALQYMTATKATLLWGLLPLITHGIAFGAGRARSSWAHLLALSMGLCGVYALVGMHRGGSLSFELFSIESLADVLMIIAVIAAALDYIGTERLMDERHDIVMSNGCMMLVGGFCSIITAYGIDGAHAFSTIAWRDLMPSLLGIVFFVNCIGLLLQSYLVRYYSVTLLALSSLVTPLLGVGMSIWLCHEQWNVWYSIALFCIMGGVMIVYIAELGHKNDGIDLQEYV